MRLSQIATVSVFLLGLIGVFQNCSQRLAFDSSVVTPQPKDVASMQSLIYQTNNHDLGCNDVNDCVALAMGAKACGGPTSYLVASRNNSDFEALTALVGEYNAQATAANLASGAVSTCSFLEEPSVSCNANLCELSLAQ